MPPGSADQRPREGNIWSSVPNWVGRTWRVLLRDPPSHSATSGRQKHSRLIGKSCFPNCFWGGRDSAARNCFPNGVPGGAEPTLERLRRNREPGGKRKPARETIREEPNPRPSSVHPNGSLHIFWDRPQNFRQPVSSGGERPGYIQKMFCNLFLARAIIFEGP